MIDMEKPKKSQKQQYWEDRADKLALLTGKQIVVIEQDKDHYQCWNKSIADHCKSDYVYCTKESVEDATEQPD